MILSFCYQNRTNLGIADGAVEFSVEKLSVLPSVEAVGGVEIHLGKTKKRKYN